MAKVRMVGSYTYTVWDEVGNPSRRIARAVLAKPGEVHEVEGQALDDILRNELGTVEEG